MKFHNKKLKIIMYVFIGIISISFIRSEIFIYKCTELIKNNPKVFNEINYRSGNLSLTKEDKDEPITEDMLEEIKGYLSNAKYLSVFNYEFYDKYKAVQSAKALASINLYPTEPSQYHLLEISVYYYSPELIKVECSFRKEKTNLKALVIYFIEM